MECNPVQPPSKFSSTMANKIIPLRRVAKHKKRRLQRRIAQFSTQIATQYLDEAKIWSRRVGGTVYANEPWSSQLRTEWGRTPISSQLEFDGKKYRQLIEAAIDEYKAETPIQCQGCPKHIPMPNLEDPSERMCCGERVDAAVENRHIIPNFLSTEECSTPDHPHIIWKEFTFIDKDGNPLTTAHP